MMKLRRAAWSVLIFFTCLSLSGKELVRLDTQADLDSLSDS